MLSGLNHLTLAVTNLEHSIEFYSDLLGFRLHARWDTGAYLSLGELWLCLSKAPNDGNLAPANGYTHFAFSVEAKDFIALCESLRQAQIPEWRDNTSEGASIYFLDPDGHQLEAHVGSLETRLAECRAHPYAGMVFYD
jgi:catechol 2,3-dioxygenase-like lactoylglutathione lyase family enzyme